MENFSYIIKAFEVAYNFVKNKAYSIFFRVGLVLFVILIPFFIDYKLYFSDSIVHNSQIKTIKEINSLIASKETDSLSKKRLIELRNITLSQTNYKEDISYYFTLWSSSFSRFLKDKEISLTAKKIENPQIVSNKRSIFFDELMLSFFRKLPYILHYITSNWIVTIIFLIIPSILRKDISYQMNSRGIKIATILLCWTFIIIWGFAFSWLIELIPPYVNKNNLFANSLKNVLMNIAFVFIFNPKLIKSILQKNK